MVRSLLCDAKPPKHHLTVIVCHMLPSLHLSSRHFAYLTASTLPYCMVLEPPLDLLVL